MPDSRRSRYIADLGLQPERTSLAWFRTLLDYGALMALAIKHSRYQVRVLFWMSIVMLAIVAIILQRHARSRSLMDVSHSDFSESRAVRGRFMVSLVVLSLAMLFVVTHVRQLIAFIGNFA